MLDYQQKPMWFLNFPLIQMEYQIENTNKEIASKQAQAKLNQ